MSEEFCLSSKKKNLYQNLINNLQKAYNDKINPIGIIQMFIKLSEDIDKEFIKELKEDLFDWVGGVDERIEDCDAIDKIINKLAGKELEDE